jgi:hypothetical protein
MQCLHRFKAANIQAVWCACMRNGSPHVLSSAPASMQLH